MAGREVVLIELRRRQQQDMPLSSVIAKELGQRVQASGSAPAATSASSSDELRAALSDLVDATLDGELTAHATREVANASNGEASTTIGDDVQLLAERAADEIVAKSPAYRMLQDAVRQAAAAASDASTGIKCEDKGAASGHKKAKHDADIDGSSNVLSNATADEVWGTNDDDYDDDPFAPSNTSTPGAATSSNTGAVKSFSLFDMLDSQPGMGFSAERVTARKILSAFGGTNAGGGDAKTMEDDSDAQYNEAASLLERVDDLEDLLFDPFGESGGDSWPDINRILRCGLGLGDADHTGKDPSAPTATAETPPSLDVVVRYAHIHSKLDGLCGSSSSSSGIDFGPQRMELLINMADALMTMHNRLKGKWCTIKDSGEVYMAEGIVTLVQIMLDMLIISAPVLELVMEEDCHRFLLGIMKILAMTPSPERGGISLVHAISACDPYAEWFSLLSRFVHQAALIKTAVEAGMLKKVVEICNEGPERQATAVKLGTVLTNDCDMVAIGTAADLDHCLYLHSLSVLRTLLVVTAASERAFPYQDIGVKAGNSLSENVSRALSPFINVLSVGAKGGVAVVDERLASLCEEASGTLLRGIKQNKAVFEAVFQTIVAASLKEMVAANANPSVSAINKLQNLAS